MDWRMLLLAFLQNTMSDEELLLDTSKFTTELSRSGWKFPNNSKWQDVSSTDEEGNAVRVLQVCDMKTPNQNNWVQSPFIRTNGANQVELEIKFAIRTCSSMVHRPISCREKFTVYMRGLYENAIQNEKNWSKIDTIADSGVQKKTFTVQLKDRRGLYIGFHDLGSCSLVQQVKVISKFCPRIVHGFAIFARTITGGEGRIVDVKGHCISNGENVIDGENPIFHCGSDGNWILNTKQCHCSPGSEADEKHNTCVECSTGYYKSRAGNGSCIQCPTNSNSPDGSRECICDIGSFRPFDASVNSKCQFPPSRMSHSKLHAQRMGSTLKLSWLNDLDNDVSYRIYCYECTSKNSCKPCPRSMKLPRQPFQKTVFELEGLLQILDYKIEIIAENSISIVAQQAGVSPAVTSYFSKRLFHEEFRVVRLVLLEVGTNEARFQIEHEPKNIEYDGINILLNGTSKTIRHKVGVFTVGELQHDQLYEIQVNIIFIHHVSPWSRVVRFKTTSMITKELMFEDESKQTNQWIAGIITGVTFTIICVVVFVFIRFRQNSGNSWVKGTRSSLEQFSVATTSSNQCGSTINATVDLIPFMTKPSTEINPTKIEIGTLLGPGRMGKVTEGLLYNRRVAIKHLSMHHFELNSDYMKDLCLFAQLDYEYLVKINGFVTKSYPNLIIMEEMELGNLPKYLNSDSYIKSERTYASIMRDVTDAIAYLHMNHFVLRHVDDEHVMVTAKGGIGPLFKLRISSKYTLSHVTDDQSENPDHISVRQVAPEVIHSQRFTAESDIWSFGVFMWRIISATETPYWGLSNLQVVHAVRGGWRLPKPNANGPLSDCFNDSLHAVMLMCWEDHPTQRPSAKELQFKLEKFHATLGKGTVISLPGIPV